MAGCLLPVAGAVVVVAAVEVVGAVAAAVAAAAVAAVAAEGVAVSLVAAVPSADQPKPFSLLQFALHGEMQLEWEAVACHS